MKVPLVYNILKRKVFDSERVGLTTVKRREVLKRDFGFWCICDACVSQKIPSLYMEDVRSKHVFVRNTLSMERNQNKHKLSQALGMNPLFMVRVTTDHLISCLLEMKSNQGRQISEEIRQMFEEIKRLSLLVYGETSDVYKSLEEMDKKIDLGSMVKVKEKLWENEIHHLGLNRREYPSNLEVIETPGMGQGVVASKDFKAGEVVLTEYPLLTLSIPLEADISDMLRYSHYHK